MSVLEQQQATETPPDPNVQGGPPPAEEQIDQDPEGTQLVGDQRLAPVSEVIKERRARQAAAKERDALKQEVEQLRKIKEYWDTVEPYIPLLATHPQITGKPQPPATTETQDPELTRIAETLGFYDAAGQPDVNRAAKARELFRGEAKTVTEEVVKPVASTALETRARDLYQWAITATDTNGRPVASKEHFDAIYRELPLESRANPQMIQAALLMARGLGVPPASEPLHTEGAGGAPGSVGKTLSAIERAAAKARGMTEDQWIKARDAEGDILE